MRTKLVVKFFMRIKLYIFRRAGGVGYIGIKGGGKISLHA
jgi:hypothetical protein